MESAVFRVLLAMEIDMLVDARDANIMEDTRMNLRRRDFLRLGAAGGVLVTTGGLFVSPRWLAQAKAAAERDNWATFQLDDDVIQPPEDPALWPAFRRELEQWRIAKRDELGYDASAYEDDAFRWGQTNFSCCFLMLWDEAFYDADTHRYLVETFLQEDHNAFGGYDSVVLWHAYPRIGVDDRNQFDFYRDMPGGLTGLRALVDRFHAAEVRVFLDYIPWDEGTRREPTNDLDTLAMLVEKLDADGLFLDTLHEGTMAFREKLDAVKPGVVLETELALPLDKVSYHHMSWAQWFPRIDGEVPGILRNKWFERRHMQHQIERWNPDHSGELHQAWMNGSGMAVWENVFGSWVGWSARDRSILRSMLPIQRRFTRLFCGEDWMPLTPTLQPRIYASRWGGDAMQLWTLVNRGTETVWGALIEIAEPFAGKFYDLIAGREIHPHSREGRAVLEGRIGPRGIGAFLAAAPSQLDDDFAAFLAHQAGMDAQADWDTTSVARWSHPIEPKLNARATLKEKLEDMAYIPSVRFDMNIVMRTRECGFYADPDLDPQPPRKHHEFETIQRTNVELKAYAIDLTPVTNAQFNAFIKATGYRPTHAENFLKHWPNGSLPEELAHHPVVYVDLADARAYAAWRGKRLPTEAEWQYAAQGPAGLRYPWGNEYREDCCNDGSTGSTTQVKAYPQGRSPFGCYDMCGNTWEWTESERSDERTRFCIIRGSSFYQAHGSDWYTDGGPRPANFAAKFLLMWPGLDRCATIGFRCAGTTADAET